MKFLSLLIHNPVTKGFWTPIPITSHDPFISHTLFEDDVFLFAEAISQYTKVILHVLEDFTHYSGLHINYTKSKNLFSKNCLNTIQSNITNILTIKQTFPLENYLGFPLLQRAPKHSNFSPILMALNAKMTNWKTKIPTMAGRVILAKVVLSSIPTHVMQCHNLHTKTTNSINKTIRDFIWGSTDKGRRIHLLHWNITTLPRKLGGLQIWYAKYQNTTSLALLLGDFTPQLITKSGSPSLIEST